MMTAAAAPVVTMLVMAIAVVLVAMLMMAIAVVLVFMLMMAVAFVLVLVFVMLAHIDSPFYSCVCSMPDSSIARTWSSASE